ncbi:polysaccharide biosynthesis/export family protein [Sporomusa termitida]|uniref:Putative polysaccharide export protein, PEP-CTERM sytem-associated n=1 Tax=Sporomusa termitida TaxID=2377 RepID=A0A517DXQ4_9FIRM|nr:polysaccharide biosynthesis/export family protein [Sporomusa termitida]QDR82026.1 putative polysaccharide export protein, PEP-CTERM sytem-associated [Sporomusa termitida]
MRQPVTVLIILFLMMTLPLASTAQDYQLGPGDVLAINVWGFEELKIEELPIRPDGKIAIPLAGELQAGGMTPGELAGMITTQLSHYLKNPVVSVNVAKFRTTRVYVLGEVFKPGMYEIEKQHNLIDAIGMAGSYTKYAAKKKVYIIRQDQTDKPLKVNLLNLIEKGDMSQNVLLHDGDIVYLTKSNKIDFAKDILPWISATYQISETRNN